MLSVNATDLLSLKKPVYFRVFIGGKKFCTTVDTLTQREPDSMLAAMFSGRHTVCEDPEKVFTFLICFASRYM